MALSAVQLKKFFSRGACPQIHLKKLPPLAVALSVAKKNPIFSDNPVERTEKMKPMF